MAILHTQQQVLQDANLSTYTSNLRWRYIVAILSNSHEWSRKDELANDAWADTFKLCMSKIDHLLASSIEMDWTLAYISSIFKKQQAVWVGSGTWWLSYIGGDHKNKKKELDLIHYRSLQFSPELTRCKKLLFLLKSFHLLL